MQRDVLACDVGGTNTSIALLSGVGTQWRILRRFRFQTQSIPSLEDAVNSALRDIEADDSLRIPSVVSVSGAGPIRDAVCYLSNVAWTISTERLERETGLPALLINDFSAISYGIPLLDSTNDEQIGVLHENAAPTPAGVRLVIGAGTGLGVGYLVGEGVNLRVYPSEGGHSAFAPYDEDSRGMYAMLAAELDEPPGSELFVSGRGIANSRRFYQDRYSIPKDSDIATIDTGEDVAVRVSRAATAGDPDAAAIMRLFVRNYARVCSGAVLHFLPAGGLYLAGGIVSKNEHWFSKDDLFIREFQRNYRSHISDLLARVPVYVVRDYEISLYGAAYAAVLHNDQEAP